MNMAVVEMGQRSPAGGNGRGIPSGFKLSDGGVYFQEEDEWVWLCSHLDVVALTCDERGDSWGSLLRFRDSNNCEHAWAMPSRMLHSDGAEYREILLDMGLRIGYGRKARSGLHGYLTACRPSARATAVSRLGWHGAAFVTPDRVFGEDPHKRVILQLPTPIDHAIRTSGKLADWRENIGRLCGGNSRLILGVSLAFAAPLLHLASEESGGAHLRGPSSVGKTTVLLVASSVCGGGGIHGYLRSWRATANGLEPVAAAHCDLLLPLDEISQADSKAVAEAAYQLANGIGKHRANRSGGSRPPATWRTLFLSTGEIGLADKIAETADVGQPQVRRCVYWTSRPTWVSGWVCSKICMGARMETNFPGGFACPQVKLTGLRCRLFWRR
jgi:putative DNA primase/helicase